MKKRIFAALLCVIMLFGMLPVTALAANDETIAVPEDKLVVKNGILTGIEPGWLKDHQNDLLSLTVPKELNGITIIAIANNAFKKNYSSEVRAYLDCNLVSVDLSATEITAIGKMAFYERKNLKTVILPDTLEILGDPNDADSVFTDCNSIESIRTASSDENAVFELPSHLTYIGKHTFKNCFANDVDTKVIIPASVKTIGQEAFYDNSSPFAISQIIVKRTASDGYDSYASDAFDISRSDKRITIFPDYESYNTFYEKTSTDWVKKAYAYPIEIKFLPNGPTELHLNHANFNYQLDEASGFWCLDNEYTLPETGSTPSDKPGYDYLDAWYLQSTGTPLKLNQTLASKGESSDTANTKSNAENLVPSNPTVSYIVDNQDVVYDPSYDTPLQVTVGGSVGVKVDHPLLKEEGHYGTDEDYVYFKYCWWDEVGNEDFTNTVNGPRSNEEPELFSNAPSDRAPNRVFVDSNSIPVTKLDHTRIDRSQYMVEIYGYHVKDSGEPELFYKSSENFIHFGSGDVEATDGCYTLQVEVVERADPISTALTSLILVAGLGTDDHIAYVYGYPDGTVRPNETITRAEVTTIFYRLLTSARRDEIFTSENSFRDVDSSMWYNKATSSMAAGGYIQGYADGTFGANKPITRAEFVCLAARFATKTTGFASYTDVDNGHWAARSIAICASNGWVQGYEDGTFRPDQPITRAEAMAIINRMLGRGVSKGYVCKGAARFTDNDPGSWYYYEILEATNDHEYRNARPFEQWIRATILRSYDMDKYERP